MKKGKRAISWVVVLLLVSGFYYPGKSVRAESVFNEDATTRTIISNLCEKSFGKDLTYRIMQGGCMDEKGFAYFYMKNAETEKTKEVGRIIKVNLSTKETVKRSEPLFLNHGNDMTYNAFTNKLLIVHAYDRKLSLLNPDTLVCEETITTKESYYSIGYDRINNRYVAGVLGTYDTVILNSQFEEVKRFASKEFGYLRQGMDCDANYIYYVQSPLGKNSENSIIVVYDWNGNHIQNIKIKGKKEAENIFHVGSNFYVGYNTKNAGEVHEIQFKRQ